VLIQLAAELFMAISLGAAAIQDIHNRMINDLTWFLAAPGAALSIWLISKSPPYLTSLYLLDAGIGIILAIAIWITKAMGEADAIAIGLISITTIPPPPLTPLDMALNTPIIATLVNSMIITIPFIIWNAALNLKRMKKCPEISKATPLVRVAYIIFLTCEQSIIVRRKPWAYSPGKLSIRISDDAAQVTEGLEYMLVSYNMPYVAYIFMGYVIYILIGNLMLPLILLIA